MRDLVAVDAGGTSTRAVLVDAEGRCRGYGRASGGNPTSVGMEGAIEAVATAVEHALGGVDAAAAGSLLVAHAGGGGAPFREGIWRRLAPIGFHGSIATVGDLVALFASGTPESDGAALIAGTGAIGGAVAGGRIVRVVDGTGWLLGDAGSGFWIGHRVARAVVDDLDGGPRTRLTAALLAELGLEVDRTLVDGRPRVLGHLVTRLYETRPVELSRLAPMAFALAAEDRIAAAVVRDAVAALAALLRRVRSAQAGGPLVFGGSVIIEGVLRLDPELAAPLVDAAGGSTPIPVADGLVGAAVLALRQGGVPVDAELHATLTASIRGSVPGASA